ncbi:hypothetical protein NL676_009988 [Syzygium grande]|nr:hypothetical protein NL676_009988 [Syzygium grande]
MLFKSIVAAFPGGGSGQREGFVQFAQISSTRSCCASNRDLEIWELAAKASSWASSKPLCRCSQPRLQRFGNLGARGQCSTYMKRLLDSPQIFKSGHI